MGVSLVAIAVPIIGPTLGLLLLTVAGLLAVWAFAATAATKDALAATQYATGLVLLTLVPDVAFNAGVRAQWIALIALHAVLLLWRVRIHIEARDVGLLLVVGGAVFPAFVSSELAVIPGTLLAIAAPYALGRGWQPSRSRLIQMLLVVGAIHGFVAIGQYVPELRLLAQSELSGTRASGLFNNPNTLGVLEAIVLIGTFAVGVPRRLWPLAALCLVGLILSSSREALLGLVVGVAIVGVRHPRRSGVIASALAGVAVIVIVLVPTLLARLDPAVYLSDPNLLGRYRTWAAAVDLIGRSPLIGYGATLPVAVVDQAFLGWLLAGGVVSLVTWVVGIAVLAVSARVWPIVLGMVAIGFLANPFSGVGLSALLLVAGSGGLLAGRDPAGTHERIPDLIARCPDVPVPVPGRRS